MLQMLERTLPAPTLGRFDAVDPGFTLSLPLFLRSTSAPRGQVLKVAGPLKAGLGGILSLPCWETLVSVCTGVKLGPVGLFSFFKMY